MKRISMLSILALSVIILSASAYAAPIGGIAGATAQEEGLQTVATEGDKVGSTRLDGVDVKDTTDVTPDGTGGPATWRITRADTKGSRRINRAGGDTNPDASDPRGPRAGGGKDAIDSTDTIAHETQVDASSFTSFRASDLR